MSVNEIASAGFERGAADYERARPGYPEAMLDALPLDGVVLDLAAGTGKLTRQLAAHATVFAVEPVDAMRAIAAQFAPTAAGVAEGIPLRDGSVGLVTVAQAFHWFRPEPALREIARVLQPGGTLAMMWNEWDESVPWVAEVHRRIRSRDYGTPHADEIDWAAVVAQHGSYSPLVQTDFANPFAADRAAVVGRALSTSFVSASPPDVRDAVARDVHEVVADFDEPFDFPYVTHLFTCRPI